MNKFRAICLAGLLTVPAFAQKSAFVGRWDITLTSPTRTWGQWMEVVEKDGALGGRVQPSGGSVRDMIEAKVEGSKLIVTTSRQPLTVWELSGSGDRLTGSQKAGENGYAWAFSQLGDFYLRGRYVTKDIHEAIYWYEKAYEAGVTYASVKLAHTYEIDAVPRDFQQALFWYRKGAEDGLVYSQRLLGYFYFRGQGVPQDYAISLNWFMKVMEPRNYEVSPDDKRGPEAMIATYYEHGLGVAKNVETARHWYRLSAADGETYANYALGRFYERGDGVPADLVEAMRWYQEAANREYEPAQYRIGLAYDRGEGVARDAIKAVMWLTLATADCCEGRQQAYEEFDKDPIFFAIDWRFLNPKAQDAAQRDLARVKRVLSAAEIEAGEALAQGFVPIRPPLIVH